MRVNKLNNFIMYLHWLIGHQIFRHENVITFCITCVNKKTAKKLEMEEIKRKDNP